MASTVQGYVTSYPPLLATNTGALEKREGMRKEPLKGRPFASPYP